MNTRPPEDKVQLGVYVPQDINEWVNEVRELTGLHKSEIVHLLCAYARKFWTPEELLELAEAMRLFGESGIERVNSHISNEKGE